METPDKKSEFELIKETVLLWLKHWYYFIISLFICGILAFAYIHFKTPVMRIVAKVSLRHNESPTSSAVPVSSSVLSAFGFGGGGSENIEDESLKMSSLGYLKNVVKKLDLNKDYTQTEYLGFVKTRLYDKSPVVLSIDSSVSDTITKRFVFNVEIKENKTTVKMKLGRRTIGKYEIVSFPTTVETPFGPFTFSKSQYYDEYDKPMKLNVFYANYDYMTQIYQNQLSVEFEKKTSDIINLGMDAENVFLAKQFLSEIINVYNYEWDLDKEVVSDKTISFIDKRLELVQGKLAEADRDIQKFKDSYNMTEVEADVTYYLKASGELQISLLEAETQLNIVDLIVDFVSDEKNKYALVPYSITTSDPSFSELITKYNEELTRRNDFAKSNLQTSLSKSMDENLEVQRNNLLQSLANVKKGLKISVDNIKRKDKEFTDRIGKVPTIERDYVHLRREQEVQQTIYIFLLQMREETGVKGVSVLPKLKVIDEPYIVNKPVSPNLMKVALMVIFFGGILFPASAIYLLPYLRKKIRERKRNKV